MLINKEVAALLDYAVKTRRELHKIPEVGFELYKTHRFVVSELEKLKPDVLETMADTGVKAVWFAREPVDTIAFRADMDGLNVLEQNETDYVSSHVGKMHGCGHDGHMTMLLMLAKLVDSHRDQLKNNVVLLFQPAEEGWGGAAAMIEDGALEDPRVDRIYGIHLWPTVPKGRIGIRWGYMMARSCEFDIYAQGISAHGASPQMGVDAIVAAAELIIMLQSAITRSVDPHQDALLTIGRVNGGSARNVIADQVEMNGTLRVFSSEVYDNLMARIHAMTEGVALATGARFNIFERMQYPSVENPRPMVEDLYTYTGMEDIVLVEPAMAAEDFACYQQKVPGIFMWLGIQGGKNQQPLHNCRFDFDEDVLLVGVEVYRRLLGICQQADIFDCKSPNVAIADRTGL